MLRARAQGVVMVKTNLCLVQPRSSSNLARCRQRAIAWHRHHTQTNQERKKKQRSSSSFAHAMHDVMHGARVTMMMELNRDVALL